MVKKKVCGFTSLLHFLSAMDAEHTVNTLQKIDERIEAMKEEEKKKLPMVFLTSNKITVVYVDRTIFTCNV
jgi:hypothetical protein